MNNNLTSNTSTNDQTHTRRHDLDALRAVAMLLGIALHASLSFIPDVWKVQDSQQDDIFYLFVAAVHGFRMPLFFLLSGFFTAMLWQKRGLRSLIRHRVRRIFLPLILGLLTVIPAITGIIIIAEVTKESTIWTAAENGDIAALTEYRDAGDDLQISYEGWTLLHVAIYAGQDQAVVWLIDNGADVNARSNDGTHPLDIALAESNTSIAQILQKNGADTELNDEAIHEQNILTTLMEAEIFAHLWFLWFLCWLVVIFLGSTILIDKIGLQMLPVRWVQSPLCYLWLVPLTMIPLAFMVDEGSFGATTSTGLIPIPDVLAYYAIFFGFGVLYYHSNAHEAEQYTRWRFTLALGLIIVFPLGLGSSLAGADLLLPSAFLQSLYAWLMTFGMMGLFHQYFANESQPMRYVSDASYFLYLAHLPLIFVGQTIVRYWEISPLLKFTLICVVVTSLLLFVYEHLVRYRWLGTFLNGTRQRPAAHSAKQLVT